MNRDLYSNLGAEMLQEPDTLAVNTDTASIDLRERDSAMIAVLIGTTKNAGFAVAMEESDDDGVLDPFAAVAAGDLQGPDVALAASTMSVYGYKGHKRYIRMAMTIPGNTEVAVVALAGHPVRAPIR